MLIKNTGFPLVSVIVPTYNRAYCLARTIQSVLDQTFNQWELIIIDNYSKDNTDDLIKGYADSRIKYIKIHNNGIVAASRNKGISIASGKYLAFLDSDDWWMPKKLEKSIQALKYGADFVYHDLYQMPWCVNKLNPWRKVKTRLVKSPVFDDLLFNGNAIVNSSVVVRHSTIKKVGGFSEDKQLIAAEDYDAWLRIAKLTDKFTRLPDCLGYYMMGEDNLSSAERSIVNVKRLLALYDDDIQKPDKDIPGWMSYALASGYYKTQLFDQARQYILKTITGSASIHLKMRSIMLLLIGIKQG